MKATVDAPKCCPDVLQLNELVVGDTSGKLLVYKNDEPKPWLTRTCVGMVSAGTRNGPTGLGKERAVIGVFVS